jgi:hypothetical protein
LSRRYITLASLIDHLQDHMENSWTEVGQSSANAIVTVTKAAAARRRHAIMTVDASYSSSTASGELTVSFGSTVIGRKHIHGGGALDFGDLGIFNPDTNEAVSAELAAGGAGIVGDLTMSGYTTFGA